MPTKEDFAEIAHSLRAMHPDIARAFDILSKRNDLQTYTVATLPDANAQNLIYVSDGTSNKRLAVSDGTNWRFPDGNVVS